MATKIDGAAQVMTAFTRAEMHEKIATKVQAQAKADALQHLYKSVKDGGKAESSDLQKLSKGFSEAGTNFVESDTAPVDDGNTNTARGAAPPTKYRVHDLLPGCTYQFIVAAESALGVSVWGKKSFGLVYILVVFFVSRGAYFCAFTILRCVL